MIIYIHILNNKTIDKVSINCKIMLIVKKLLATHLHPISSRVNLQSTEKQMSSNRHRFTLVAPSPREVSHA